MIEHPWMYVSILGATIASIVGLVVWLIKTSFKRQNEITERYFAYLERQQRDVTEMNEKLAGAFGELSKVLHGIDQRTNEHKDAMVMLTHEMAEARKDIAILRKEGKSITN